MRGDVHGFLGLDPALHAGGGGLVVVTADRMSKGARTKPSAPPRHTHSTTKSHESKPEGSFFSLFSPSRPSHLASTPRVRCRRGPTHPKNWPCGGGGIMNVF